MCLCFASHCAAETGAVMGESGSWLRPVCPRMTPVWAPPKFTWEPLPSAQRRLILDTRHVVVGEAEMVTDLVNQHVRDQIA